jgi:beta-glucosidase
VDRRAQEDSRLFTFSGAGEQSVAIVTAGPLDIAREANAELSLLIDYSVRSGPTGPVRLGMDKGSVPVTQALRAGPKGEWRRLTVPLRCFAKAGVEMANVSTPFVLSTSGKLAIAISDIRIASAAVPQDRCSL